MVLRVRLTPVLSMAFAVVAPLVCGTAPAALAQSRTQIAAGFGIASGAGSLGALTGVGMSGSLGVGFPRGDRLTFWLEGWAEGLPADSDPYVEQTDWQYSTRYLAAAEYRFTRLWNPWRLSGSLGLGATTFWDNSWTTYTPDFNAATYTLLSGTYFTVAPGFRAAYAVSPNLALELIGRVNMALTDGETFSFDTTGVWTPIEPPGSPITSWGLTLGTRLRAGGAPSEWADLEPGDRVRAWTLSGHQVEGRLVSMEDGRLRLAARGESIDVALDGLQNAAVLHTKAQKGGVLGAAIGGGTGMLLGLLAAGVGCSLDDSASGCTTGEYVTVTVGLGLTGAVAGFVFGTLLGNGSDEWTALPVR